MNTCFELFLWIIILALNAAKKGGFGLYGAMDNNLFARTSFNAVGETDPVGFIINWILWKYKAKEKSLFYPFIEYRHHWKMGLRTIQKFTFLKKLPKPKKWLHDI